MSYHHSVPEPKSRPRPMFADAEKCPGCGCTLKTALDRQLHVCDPVLTTRNRMRGDRTTRGSV